MESNAPKISVIVPAYNAAPVLPVVLEAIRGSTVAPDELIVVDDGSTDETIEVARQHGARILQTDRRQSGPGRARNQAAREAVGEILLFIDSDVVVERDTIERVIAGFEDDPEIVALFGSYDDEPAEPNFLSQYKNLQHHWVHQSGSPDAATFWAGCGAIRRQVFLEVDGFDAEKYPMPAIEDIELGYRLKDRGYRIRLDRDIKVKHLKKWTFRGLVHTEIFCRAVPWSNLIMETRRMERDLNLKQADRISSLLAGLIVLLLPLMFFSRIALVAFPLVLGLYIWLNREFYGFFWRRRGLFFALRVIPVHLLYYLYSAAAFAACWLRHRLAAPRRAA